MNSTIPHGFQEIVTLDELYETFKDECKLRDLELEKHPYAKNIIQYLLFPHTLTFARYVSHMKERFNLRIQ